MNAAETIAAAIAKLEAERDALPRGPWSLLIENIPGGGHSILLMSPEPLGLGLGGDSIALEVTDDWDTGEAGGRLIETLHRTIDAQLAILREAHDNATERPAWNIDTELTLARAILGGEAR